MSTCVPVGAQFARRAIILIFPLILLAAMLWLSLAPVKPAAAQAPVQTPEPPALAAFLPFAANYRQTDSITVGTDFSCALDDSGRAWCWGANDEGQLGDGSRVDRDSAGLVRALPAAMVAIGANTSTVCAGRHDGLWCWGAGYGVTPQRIQGMSGVTGFAQAREGELCALTGAGEVWCWQAGQSAYEALGGESAVALASGGAQCAVVAVGAVRCWDFYGMEGNLPFTWPGVTEIVDVTSHGVRRFRGYGMRLCFLNQSGVVSCWTGWDHDAVPIGSYTPPPEAPSEHIGFPTGAPVIAEIEGANVLFGLNNYSYVCGRDSAGRVRCIGNPADGQGGLGTQAGANELVPNVVAKDIAVRAHVCARTVDGAWCWGTNARGRLGNPAALAKSEALLAMPVGGSISVAVTEYGTINVDRMGRVEAWGEGAFEQAVATPTPIEFGAPALGVKGNCVLLQNQDLRCAQPGLWTGQRFSMPNSSGARDVADDGSTGCFVRSDGALRCWSDASTGRVRMEVPNSSKAVAVAADVHAGADQDYCSVTESGRVECWGLDPLQTAISSVVTLSGLEQIVQIAGASMAGCARNADGGVFCWGDNTFGSIGDGTTIDPPAPLRVPGLGNIIDLKAEFARFCALRAGGAILCWGNRGAAGPSTPTVVLNAPGATVIEFAGDQLCAVVAGELFCKGSNLDGQLARNPGWTPVKVVGFGAP